MSETVEERLVRLQKQHEELQRAMMDMIHRMSYPLWIIPSPVDPDMTVDEGL